MGAGTVQVCTAAMTYGFKIVEEMIAGLVRLDGREGLHARSTTSAACAVPNVTDWQYLNLNYVTKAVIDQDLCIKCGRCHIACEDTSHQAITSMVDGLRKFEVKDEECVGCNLCVEVCPVENCITMVPMQPGDDRPAHRRARAARLCQLDHAPQQPDGAAGGGVGDPATIERAIPPLQGRVRPPGVGTAGMTPER